MLGGTAPLPKHPATQPLYPTSSQLHATSSKPTADIGNAGTMIPEDSDIFAEGVHSQTDYLA